MLTRKPEIGEKLLYYDGTIYSVDSFDENYPESIANITDVSTGRPTLFIYYFQRNNEYNPLFSHIEE